MEPNLEPVSPQRWTVTPQDSSPNALATAAGIQAILNRTQTLQILGEVLYPHIVTGIVVVLTLAFLRRLRTAGLRFSAIDALAVPTLVGALWVRDMVLSIGTAAAYAVLMVLAERPWNLLGGLPGLEEFVSGLQPASETGGKGPAETSPPEETATLSPEEEQEREPNDCLICWSTEDSPLRLPCAHVVCKACLLRLQNASGHKCPLCRLPLFRMNSAKSHLFQLYIATAAAVSALGFVLALLKAFKGKYYVAAIYAVVTGGMGALGVISQTKVMGTAEGLMDLRTMTLAWFVVAYLVHLKTVGGEIARVDHVVFLDGVVQRFWGVRGGEGVVQVLCEWVPWAPWARGC